MKHFTIVGNWKMHQNPDEAVRLVERLQRSIKPHTHVTSVVCPPFIDLIPVHQVLEHDLLKLGAQNINEFDEGTYTGEVSGAMVRTIADYVIIGHSERRKFEHENDKRISHKMAAAVRNGLIPILCIGDNLHERESGHAKRVVASQLEACLANITKNEISKIIVTYEPVWAISHGDGKGHFATPQDVEPMVEVMRQTVENIYGEGASSQLEILYGGSANPDNARAYLEIEHINGLLVGGASLNYEQFSKMISVAAKLSTTGMIEDGK